MGPPVKRLPAPVLMVIFGAGASFDSVPHRPPPDPYKHLEDPYRLEGRPPLANDLFADRPLFWTAINQFPACKPIIPLLQRPPNNASVEQVLEALQSEAQEHVVRYCQLAAVRFYLHTMLWKCQKQWDEAASGTTNYKRLLDLIDRWRWKNEGDRIQVGGYRSVCLVTFNYDTLLEAALPDVSGLSIPASLWDYVAASDTYKIIKVHGSVNWARIVTTAIPRLASRDPLDIAKELIQRYRELEISQTYRLVTSAPISKLDDPPVPAFPAIAIPMETKLDFECPAEQLDVLRTCVPAVAKLLIIGWRGIEEHFMKLLAERWPAGVTAMVVAGREDWAAEVIERLQNRIAAKWIFTRGGFTDFLSTGEAEKFLQEV